MIWGYGRKLIKLTNAIFQMAMDMYKASEYFLPVKIQYINQKEVFLQKDKPIFLDRIN